MNKVKELIIMEFIIMLILRLLEKNAINLILKML